MAAHLLDGLHLSESFGLLHVGLEAVKMIKVVLFFLIGLCLLIGGITSYMTLMITGYSLMAAGILMIIAAIAMAMMKEKMKPMATK